MTAGCLQGEPGVDGLFQAEKNNRQLVKDKGNFTVVSQGRLDGEAEYFVKEQAATVTQIYI